MDIKVWIHKLKADENIDEVVREFPLDLEFIDNLVHEVPERAVTVLEKFVDRFENENVHGANYLRVMLVSRLHDDAEANKQMVHILKTAVNRNLGIVDLVPLCYAFLHVKRIGDPENVCDRCTPILLENIDGIADLFDKTAFPDLFPRDDQGRPAPPRPAGKAPPRPVIDVNRQQRAAKRALPGYTPGWLAAEYAKKHNI